MSRWARLIKQYRHLLLLGFLFTYFSSFGQTFLISLYIPSIETFLGIENNTLMSSLYAAATICSAFSLPKMGALFDKMKLGHYMAMVIAGLVIALLTLSFSYHLVLVFLGLYLLRLFGQGLMSHTAVSTMSRFFDKNRGTSIGIATLGHPVGEASLPVLITLIISLIGWRLSLQLNAVFLALIVSPLLYWLYRQRKKQHLSSDESEPAKQRIISAKRILKQKIFWIITPAVFTLGFTNTAIFFFQLKLGAAKGWSELWVSSSLSAFAAASALGMFIAGPYVDRLTAKRLFPYILIPYGIGVFSLLITDAPIIYPTALGLMGFANGFGSTVKNALFVEMFGIHIIGKVRSLFITVMVLSTALGPLFFGSLVDLGFTFNQVFLYNAIGIMLVILWSFSIKTRKKKL